MTEPTDAEIIALLGSRQFSTIGAVREALRRWGTPPAVAAGAVPLTEDQRSDIATAAAGFNWTDDYVEAIDYVIDGVESLHGIKGGQRGTDN